MSVEWFITVGNLLTVLAFVSAGVWWFFGLSARSQANSVKAQNALDKANDAEKAIANLRIEMTRDFASQTHLREVEDRLIGAVNNLTKEIGQLRQFLMERGGGHD